MRSLLQQINTVFSIGKPVRRGRRPRSSSESLESRVMLSVDSVQALGIAQGTGQLMRAIDEIANHDPYQQRLPGTGRSIADIAAIDSPLQTISNSLASYADTGVTSTSAQYATAIRNAVNTLSSNAGVSQITVNVSSDSQTEVSVQLSFQLTRAFNTQILLGPEYGRLSNLTLESSPTISGMATTSYSLDFGIYKQASLATSEAFFLRDASIDTDIDIARSNLVFPAVYGVTEVGLSKFSLENHATIETDIRRPASATNRDILQKDFLKPEFLDLVTSTESNVFDSSMEISATIGNWSTTGIPTLAFHSDDSFATLPTISTNAAFSQLEPFGRMSSLDLAGSFRHYASIIGQMTSAVGLEAKMPFLKSEQFGEGMNAADFVGERLSQLEFTATTPSKHFESFQALRRQLSLMFPGEDPNTLLNYSATTNEVLIGLQMNGQLPVLNATAEIPAELGKLSGVRIEGDVAISRSFAITAGLGLQLGNAASDTKLTDRIFVNNVDVNATATYQSASLPVFANAGDVQMTATGVASGLVQVAVVPTLINGQRRLSFADVFDPTKSQINPVIQAVTPKILVSSFQSQGGIFEDVLKDANLILTTPTWPANATPTATLNPSLTKVANFKDLPVTAIYSALLDVKQVFDGLINTTVFGMKVASLASSVADLTKFSERFGKLLEEFRKNPPATFADAVNKLLAAMNATTFLKDKLQITFGKDDCVLHINLKTTSAVDEAAPLNIDLSALGVTGLPSLVSFSSSDIRLKGTLTFDIQLGIDMLDPLNPTPVVYDASEVRFEGRIAEQNLNADLQFGPLKLSTTGATLVVDGDGKIATDDKFVVVAKPIPVPSGKRRIADLKSSDFSSQFDGKADFLIPLKSSSVSIGTLAFSISDLRNPLASVNFFDSLDFLRNVFGSASLGDALGSLERGIDEFFESVDDALSSFAFSKLPLLGSLDIDAAKLMEDLRTKLRDEFNSLVDKAPKALRTAFFKVAGPSGLNILKDSNADNQITKDDIRLTETESDVHFEMKLGATAQIAKWKGKADLDLPGLDFKASGEIQVEMPWELQLGFGVNDENGFYVDNQKKDELSVTLTATVAGASLEGKLGFLRVRATDDVAKPTKLQVTALVDFKDLDGNGRWTFNEFPGFRRVITDTIGVTLSGSAKLNLNLVADFGSDDAPSISTKLGVDWTFTNATPGTSWRDFGSVLDVRLTDSRINVGEWLKRLVKPYLDFANDVFEPIRPVLDFLQKELPHVGITVMDLLGLSSQQKRLVRFLGDLNDVVVSIDRLVNDGIQLNLGTFVITTGDIREPKVNQTAAIAGSIAGTTPDSWQKQIPAGTLKTVVSTSLSIGDAAIEFPFLEEPLSIFDLLLGKDIQLVGLTLPSIEMSASRQVAGTFGVFAVQLSGQLQVQVSAALGFDTRGLRVGNFQEGFFVLHFRTSL